MRTAVWAILLVICVPSCARSPIRSSARREHAGESAQADRVRRLFKQAQVALDQGQFDLAEAHCQEVLPLDPSAFDPLEAQALFHAARYDENVRELASTQLMSLARWDPEKPESRDDWRNIARRKRPHLGLGAAELREVDVIRIVKEKMHTMVLSVDFRDTPLPEVVTYLRASTRLNILVDEESIQDPDSVKVTLAAVDRPIDSLLDEILEECRLREYIVQGTLILTARD